MLGLKSSCGVSEIDAEQNGQYALLGVFLLFRGWKAIDMALHQNGKMIMKKCQRPRCHFVIPLAWTNPGQIRCFMQYDFLLDG